MEHRGKQKLSQTEVLAPAGSFAAFRAALAAGADAVYVGGSSFGARAFAENFTAAELIEAIDQAHLAGKKLYLTVNTLLKEQEWSKQLVAYLAPLYQQGLDAVIVQDMGVFLTVKEQFPELDIHASTQMSITSPHGARLLSRLGATRVVPARELSLEEVEQIATESPLEVECFVHGAMCYCYSGQCLYSSFLGGRSGNRGQCAQPCRLPYRKETDHDARYWFSMRDMNALPLIPQLIQAGVDSFKIEGRMKSPEYVAFTTALYRKYVDRYETDPAVYEEQGRPWEIDSQDLLQMQNAFHREDSFTGYYTHRNGAAMVSMDHSSFQKGSVALEETLRERYLDKTLQIPIRGAVFLSPGQPASIELSAGNTSVSCLGEAVQQAVNRPLSEQRIREQLEKTGNTPFTWDTLKIQESGNVFLPMRQINELRRKSLSLLQEQLLKKYRRPPVGQEKEWRMKPIVEETNGDIDTVSSAPGFYVLVSDLCQFPPVSDCHETVRIYVDGELCQKAFSSPLKEQMKNAHEKGKELFFAMPHAGRGSFFDRQGFSEMLYHYGFDGVLARTYDELGFLADIQYAGKVALDYQLYQWNTGACHWERLVGFPEADGILPLELQKTELRALRQKDKELLVYGYIPMMVSAQCIQKTAGQCRHRSGYTKMTDRYQKEFYVKNNCQNCYNVVYNSVPLSLLHEMEEIDKLGLAAYRLEFTVETESQTEEILEAFVAQIGGRSMETPACLKNYTKGHWAKGVS